MVRCSLFVMVFGLMACGGKQELPKGILASEKMQSVLWDIIQADVFTANFISNDSTRNPAAENIKLQQQVFNHHQVSREDFYKTYSYYVEHTEMMNALLDTMTARAERNHTKAISKRQLETEN